MNKKQFLPLATMIASLSAINPHVSTFAQDSSSGRSAAAGDQRGEKDAHHSTPPPAAPPKDRDDRDGHSPEGVVKSFNGLSGQVVFSAGPGIIITQAGNGLKISANASAPSDAWNTSGNTGTTGGANFLGTTDDQPLELKINSQRALRLEPNTNGAPNVIGGASVNFAAPGTIGAAIGGGGAALPYRVGFNYLFSSFTNSVSGDFGTVGGGAGNSVGLSAAFSTVGGGLANAIQTGPVRDDPFDQYGGYYASTIAGGWANTIQSGADLSAISGGFRNIIQTNSYGSTIVAGFLNTIQNNAAFSTISGGIENTIQRLTYESVIGGGAFNSLEGLAFYSTIGGGFSNRIQWESPSATISGGEANTIQASSEHSTIAGGRDNTIQTWAGFSTIGGGWSNIIANSGLDVAGYSTIGGGLQNKVDDAAGASTIGGGTHNLVGPQAICAVVSGGQVNSALANNSTVGGGGNNSSVNSYATVSGGLGGTASGFYSIVPGGVFNTAAGDSSLAAGRRAKANHTGAFVWADSTDADVASTADDQFTARASGGVVLYSSPSLASGVSLAPGGGSWATLSDRNAKENLQPVDGTAVLDKLCAVPLATWNYKTQDESVRHLGPMAQDFHAAFQIGEDDKHITTIDAEGVALAAIQGLNQKLEDLRGELKRRDAENEALKARLDKLENLLEARLAAAK